MEDESKNKKMKTILVPIDFSPSSDNAMNYAAYLAAKVGASLLLVHVYQIPVSMNDMPVLMVSAEELKNSADKGLQKAQEELQKSQAGIEVRTESRLGDVVEELNDVCKERRPFAIVVGKHGASGMERFLFGSTTLSVINHCEVPVISVPETVKEFSLNNIALAADHAGLGKQAEAIRRFIGALEARLHIVHIQESDKTAPELKNLLPEFEPVCQTIRNEDFVHGLESYVQTNGIDLLMILPHKHSFIERTFFKTHTKELVQKIGIPIVSIAEGM